MNLLINGYALNCYDWLIKIPIKNKNNIFFEIRLFNIIIKDNKNGI